MLNAIQQSVQTCSTKERLEKIINGTLKIIENFEGDKRNNANYKIYKFICGYCERMLMVFYNAWD